MVEFAYEETDTCLQHYSASVTVSMLVLPRKNWGFSAVVLDESVEFV